MRINRTILTGLSALTILAGSLASPLEATGGSCYGTTQWICSSDPDCNGYNEPYYMQCWNAFHCTAQLLLATCGEAPPYSGCSGYAVRCEY